MQTHKSDSRTVYIYGMANPPRKSCEASLRRKKKKSGLKKFSCFILLGESGALFIIGLITGNSWSCSHMTSISFVGLFVARVVLRMEHSPHTSYQSYLCWNINIIQIDSSSFSCSLPLDELCVGTSILLLTPPFYLSAHSLTFSNQSTHWQNLYTNIFLPFTYLFLQKG